MPRNKGMLHEDEMVYFLNNRKVCDLNPNLREFLSDLFGIIEEDEVVKCEIGPEYVKTDFIVEYHGDKRNVSMKSGSANVVHMEFVDGIVNYLKPLGVSQETIDTILLFHYGDGTTDGTGKERKGYEYLMYHLKDRIKKANTELNSNNEFIIECAMHFIFDGAHGSLCPADVLYHGDYEFGTVVNRYQVKEYIKNKPWDVYDNLHIGPLFLRPHARYSTKDIVNESRRRTMTVYWPKLEADIKYIDRRFNNYVSRYRRK